MGIKSEHINKIKELTASVSGSSARLITNENFKLLSKAVVDIVDDLDIDTTNSIHIDNAVLDGLLSTQEGIDVNGGVLTVNSMGQMFAQGGIYTPLAHISRLRLDPDPTSAAIQAGEIRWSGSDFVGWNGLTWTSFTGGNYGPGTDTVTVTDVTHSELVNLIDNSLLVAGSFYRITDYRTVHYIQYTGDPGNPTPYVVGEEINIGSIEPLIVQANGPSTITGDALSETYPYDSIKYVPVMDDRDFDSVWQGPTQSRGVIVRRYDHALDNGREYDFRSFVFRRWETSPGSGVFTSVAPVTGSDSVDLPPNSSTVERTTIGYSQSAMSLLDAVELPYDTDNFVIEGVAIANSIKTGAVQHIGSDGVLVLNDVLVFGNNIMPSAFIVGNSCAVIFQNLMTTLSGGDVIGNRVSLIQGNTVVDILGGNIGGNIVDNTAAAIEGNISSLIEKNNVGGSLSFNTTPFLVDNLVSGDIIGNMVHSIESNQSTGNISRNVGGTINTTQTSGIEDCSIHSLSECILGTLANVGGASMTNVNGSGNMSNVRFSTLDRIVLDQDIRNHTFSTSMAPANFSPAPDLTIYSTPDMQDDTLPTQSVYDRGGERYLELRFENCIPAFRPITDHARFSAPPSVGALTTDYSINLGPTHAACHIEYDPTGIGPWSVVDSTAATLSPGEYSLTSPNPASGTYPMRLVFIDTSGDTYYFDQPDITWP